MSVFSNPIAVSDPSNVCNVHIGVIANHDDVMPYVNSLSVYPNPFRTDAVVFISGKANQKVSANVFNLKGQLVKTLSGMTNSEGVAGLLLSSSENLNAGIYFVSVSTSTKTMTQKVVLVK